MHHHSNAGGILSTGRKVPSRHSGAPCLPPPLRMQEGKVELGRRGEAIAEAYLAERGWVVLGRNYRAGPKEIDLIAARSGVVAFVEVKTRTTRTGGTLLEPIGALKRRAIVTAARRWIHENGRGGSVYRFDAIGVDLRGAEAVIEHVPDAWRPGG